MIQDLARMKIFCENLKSINTQGSSELFEKMKVNQFTDLTDDELLA